MNSKKHKLPRRILAMLLAICMFVGLLPVYTPSVQAAPDPSTITGGTGNETGTEATLNQSGVTIVQEGAYDTTYNIGEGQVVMIANQNVETPITFTNCTFNLSGATVHITGTFDGIDYQSDVPWTKLFISGEVEFNNCIFTTGENAGKSDGKGNDAAIYFYDGNINLNSCTVKGTNYNGQFMGLYGSEGAVTFTDSIISTEGNKDGWSYAMYAASVLKLDHSMMTATGTTVTSGNTNAFYSGDHRTSYDAVYIENGSIVDFSDNKAGGFAINNINIHVDKSSITVNDNAGNACNSGYWIVNNSSITMNGNKSGHALSCIGFDMTDSKLEILHNGYAGVYIQSRNSSLTNCTVDIRCNGEKMLSFSAGDTWVGVKPNKFNLQIDDCTSNAQPESAWLGAVGRMGSVTTTEGSSVVAYDLNSNAEDNLKSNTEPVLEEASIALNDETHQHTLLLNPQMETPYARGNAENSAGNNDADLFKDDAYYYDEENETIIDEATAKEEAKRAVLGETAKIDTLTDAQLSHHKYNWDAGELKYEATPDLYGAMAYPCNDVCGDYLNHSGSHSYSFDCQKTYVYAPLVGLGFDDNVEDGSVTNMPENQTKIAYNGTAEQPTITPTRSSSDGESWMFTGWFKDKECTEPFVFSNTQLTDNWTTVYAGWEKVEGTVTITPADIIVYTGGDSYSGVIEDLEDGSFVDKDDLNGLPEPGYYLTLPDDINEALNITDGDEGATTGANDLSNNITFIYESEDSSSGEPVMRSWPIDLYYNGEDGTSYEEDIVIDGVERDRYIYQIKPSEPDGNTVRVQFQPLTVDGTVDETADPILNDDFNLDLDTLYQQYRMTIYAGYLNQQEVKAVIKDGNGKELATLPVVVDDGTLTVRGTTDGEVVVSVGDAANAQNAVAANKNIIDEETESTITAVAPAEIEYHVNDSMVSANPADVHLLADELVVGDNADEAKAILKNYMVANNLAEADANYSYQYLDLVDKTNGNAWVTPSKEVDLYWKVPKGASSDEHDFKIVHFNGLNRQYDDSTESLIGKDGYEVEEYTVENGLEIVTINGEEYLKFSTDSFSPFVLVWDEVSTDPGPDPGTDPDNPDPDTPALDRVNHFLYVEGYPEDYRTGEYSDNEDLWPVKPQGNITRAEVATIFYRLLKDEVREEIETDVNSFPDVNKDDWFNITVSSLANMGALSGYEDGTFRPNEPISRAELAAMAVRFYDTFEAEYEEGTFLDVDGDEWYADAIAAAEELGIIGGYPDGTVRPEANITRAETCAIVNRVLERRPHDDHLGDVDDMRTWPDNQPGAWYYADMQEATNGHYYEWIDIDGSKFEEWTEVDKDYDWTKR